MEDGKKEVYFNEYCPKCKYWENEEVKDPCYDCLSEPANVWSHKPVEFVDSGNWVNPE